ncbi:HET-domain-containing protein [Zopfia rhizophila CBS 207.26]|uniref:HET-domain-containing protein n=1 Tax=Zopfia rhizophila CBS 207.26 TaxID=1314779 RepID=A0A6A6DSZ1_9PEZI|nr:HET-domain-containing protein [Zopfia rhizophila CBS 207.26]
MRLLHTTTLIAEEVTKLPIPPYAILSHTWDETELSLQDLQSPDRESKAGYKKIQQSCEIAKSRHSCIWIDTCCIDKSSSAELSEAINSMYRWYEDSEICHVYLADFESDQASVEGLRKCKWFTRGWTLQELLAPSNVIFWNKNWTKIGTKAELAKIISQITRIPLPVLRGSSPLHCTVAQRLSWASNRETTRGEDTAYSLLGLFDVHLAPIYGEGATKAFMRLQEEILRRWNDHSIFIWTPSHESRNFGLLATSPKPFCKHKECFKWLEDTDSIPEESFDPYELLRPCDPCSWSTGNDNGHVRSPGIAGQLMNHGDTAPILGPQGLQVSLLWTKNTSTETDLRHLARQNLAVCLDIFFWNRTSKAHGAKIILPMNVDLSLGFHSQDTNRRGNFSRISSYFGHGTYRLRQPNSSFKRQSFCISQQNPIAQGKHTAKFTFTALPATAEIVGSFIHAPSQLSPQLPDSFDASISIHSKGGLLSFYHSFSGTGCKHVPFYVFLGIHGQKPTPWCHILTDRLFQGLFLWSEEAMNHPRSDLYKRFEEVSTVSKSRCYRVLSCDHVVRMIVEQNPSSMQSLGFCVSVSVFDTQEEKDLSDDIMNME